MENRGLLANLANFSNTDESKIFTKSGSLIGTNGAARFSKALETIPQPSGPVDVEEVDINPQTDTTQGVLARLLRSDSPLIKEARQRAQSSANARGLQNSTIAAGAGEKAAIQESLPIASETAQQNLNVKFVNADAQNRALIVEYQELNANWREAQNLALGYYEVEAADIRAGLQRKTQLQISAAEINAANQRHRESISAQYHLQSIGHSQSIEQWALSEIGAINRDSSLTGAQQANAIKQINSIANTNFSWSNNWANSTTAPPRTNLGTRGAGEGN